MKKSEFFERFKFVPIIILVVAVLVVFCDFCEKLYQKREQVVIVEETIEEDKPLLKAKKWSGEKIKAGDAKIDINKASINDLQTLPGIGIEKALEIVRQREKMGGFKTLEDLMCTEGIGLKTFETVRSFITISEYVSQD